MRIKIIGLGLVLLGVLFIPSCQLPPETSIEWDILSVDIGFDGLPYLDIDCEITNVGSIDLTSVQLYFDIDTNGGAGEYFIWTPSIDLDEGELFDGILTVDLSDVSSNWAGIIAVLDWNVLGAGWDNPPD